MVGLGGALIGAVGWLQIVLLWVPLRLGQTEWEFGTISVTFDALPLATLGLVLALAGVVAIGGDRRLKVLAGFAGVVFLALLAALAIYLLDLPLAWKAVPPESLPALKKAATKTVLLAIAYLAIYGVFAVTAWRRIRSARAT